MKKKESDQPSATVCEGVSEGAGRSFNPSDLPEEEPQVRPSKTKDIPIGLPISPRQYKRLKKKAKTAPAPSEGIGQEDPSARQRKK